MGSLLSPAFQPFSIAACILIGLALLEAATLLIGASLSDLVDSLLGGSGGPEGAPEGGFGGLDWLNVGRVPLLVLLMILLGAFAVSGFVLQSAMAGLVAPLPPPVAALAALLPTIPLTRAASRVMGRLVPREETYVVDDEHFVGRTGIVTVGPVMDGAVARIKIQDAWGNWHFPRARPARPGEVMENGTPVLVIDRAGRELAVIAAEETIQPRRAAE